MTRFNELKRIQAAIQYQDKEQLEWAAGYCTMRLAGPKKQRKYWANMARSVLKALENIKQSS